MPGRDQPWGIVVLAQRSDRTDGCGPFTGVISYTGISEQRKHGPGPYCGRPTSPQIFGGSPAPASILTAPVPFSSAVEKPFLAASSPGPCPSVFRPADSSSPHKYRIPCLRFALGCTPWLGRTGRKESGRFPSRLHHTANESSSTSTNSPPVLARRSPPARSPPIPERPPHLA